MKLEDMPPSLRSLYQAVHEFGEACEAFYVNCEMAEAALPDTSDLRGQVIITKRELDSISRALPKLARAVTQEVDRVQQKRDAQDQETD